MRIAMRMLPIIFNFEHPIKSIYSHEANLTVSHTSICSYIVLFCQRTVLAENGGHHVEFSKVAEKWLKDYASANDFKYDVINNTDKITDYFLSRYSLFIQLDYPPFVWTGNAKQASVISLKAAEAG